MKEFIKSTLVGGALLGALCLLGYALSKTEAILPIVIPVALWIAFSYMLGTAVRDELKKESTND